MIEKLPSGLSSLAASAAMQPQEAMLEIKKKGKQLFIGIPKETSFQENRIPLIPESISLLINNGHEIFIEAGAGAASNIQDSDLSAAGARSLQSRHYTESSTSFSCRVGNDAAQAIPHFHFANEYAIN